jgi:hypothetical protein
MAKINRLRKKSGKQSNHNRLKTNQKTINNNENKQGINLTKDVEDLALKTVKPQSNKLKKIPKDGNISHVHRLAKLIS